jgi:protein-S-isoprenylcysteine O-methyltransferase Ste14
LTRYTVGPVLPLSRASVESAQPWSWTRRPGADFVRWVHRRRPLLTFLLVAAAPVYTLLAGPAPADLLSLPLPSQAVLAWLLMLAGAGVRIWGSGNLRKNQEITETGVYTLIRHPLYFGNLAIFLAFFITVGDPIVGLILFTLLAGLVYYPTMLGEERYLAGAFPEQASRYRPPPRFFPALTRLPQAMRTDRFTLGAAYRNLGLRTLWFLVALPLFLRLLGWLQGAIVT